MQVYKYLLAVKKLFERGLLSKYPVYDANYSQTWLQCRMVSYIL